MKIRVKPSHKPKEERTRKWAVLEPSYTVANGEMYGTYEAVRQLALGVKASNPGVMALATGRGT
jgi:hypothetical protein